MLGDVVAMIIVHGCLNFMYLMNHGTNLRLFIVVQVVVHVIVLITSCIRSDQRNMSIRQHHFFNDEPVKVTNVTGVCIHSPEGYVHRYHVRLFGIAPVPFSKKWTTIHIIIFILSTSPRSHSNISLYLKRRLSQILFLRKRKGWREL